MSRRKSLQRGFVLVVVPVACFLWLAIPRLPQKLGHKREPTLVDRIWAETPWVVERQREHRRVNKAHLDAGKLSIAIVAYTTENPERALPTQPADLATPPFPSKPLLKNGSADLFDPWGKQYQFQVMLWADGTPDILVLTHTPDGIPITQYGIGEKAIPTF